MARTPVAMRMEIPTRAAMNSFVHEPRVAVTPFAFFDIRLARRELAALAI